VLEGKLFSLIGVFVIVYFVSLELLGKLISKLDEGILGVLIDIGALELFVRQDGI
jgi:hypothetical protein